MGKHNAIVVNEYGGPEVLEWQELETGSPGPGEVLVRHTAIGLNMIDTYFRKGLYSAELPLVPGHEAAGTVEAVGNGVDDLVVGDRVVYAGPGQGSYQEYRVLPVDHLLPVPDGIEDAVAAASLTRGLTAEVLLTRVYSVSPGQTILVYAAAGGAGGILAQWAKQIGARVIGVVGSQAKVSSAHENGCEIVIDRSSEDIVARVRDVTDGKGVPVVYDSLGKDTFEQSLDCLSPQGLMVSYGNATGAVENFSLLTLLHKGSLFLTRPSTAHWLASPEKLGEAARSWFEMLGNGNINVPLTGQFALRDAAEAHALLESGNTTGTMILLP